MFAATAPGPGRDVVLGDSLEGRPVRNIAVLAHNLYEPLPRGPLQPLYRIANHLHVHTRAATIRDALLLRPGDPWSVERARESMRALRSLGILEPQRIGAIPVDDSVDVRVETRDDWTTQPEFAIQSANGTSFTSISLTERNVLGWGKGISLSYHEAPEGISRDAEALRHRREGDRQLR